MSLSLELKDIIDVLPAYLNQVGKEGSKNSENITSSSLGNAFQTFLPQMSVARANNVGRGMTTETMLFDEGRFGNGQLRGHEPLRRFVDAGQPIGGNENDQEGASGDAGWVRPVILPGFAVEGEVEEGSAA